jgi:DNA-binding winged helix-turn-helix (wHTH) protein
VTHATVLTVGNLNLDPAARRAWRGQTDISLSTKEFALLETFMRHPGQVLDRLQLLEHAWDYEYENRSNVIDVYVRYLREKVDRPFEVESIETVRGAGYRLRADGGVGASARAGTLAVRLPGSRPAISTAPTRPGDSNDWACPKGFALKGSRGSW